VNCYDSNTVTFYLVFASVLAFRFVDITLDVIGYFSVYYITTRNSSRDEIRDTRFLIYDKMTDLHGTVESHTS